MATVEELKKNRGKLRSKLTKFKNHLKLCLQNNEIGIIKLRLKDFLPVLSQFDSVQDEIENLLGEADEEVRDHFETEYYNCVGQAQDAIDKFNNNQSGVRVQSENNCKIKLPNFELPKFNGDIENWNDFFEVFNSTIHNNKNLEKIEKFQYLKTSCTEIAARAISSLSLSTENYEVALEILKKRFDNKRLLIKFHTNGILNLPVISKKSPYTIRRLLDEANSHLKSLKNLGLPTENWDILVIQIIVTKMDSLIKERWESISSDIPSFVELETFLLNICHTTEAINFDLKLNAGQSLGCKDNVVFKNKKLTNVSSSSSLIKCQICSSGHTIDLCSKFEKLKPNERLRKIQKLKMCVVCLKVGHKSTNCWTNKNCNVCDKRHHTMLHLEQAKKRVASSEDVRLEVENIVPSTSVTNSCLNSNHFQVFLATAVVYAQDTLNTWKPLRILLDSGSQSNLITKKACNMLNLNTKKVNVIVVGVSQNSINVNSQVNVNIKSDDSEFKTSILCFVLERITEMLPLVTVNFERKCIPSDIKLADPNFNISQDIDMLIGAELFYELLENKCIKLNSKITLRLTKFGYIVTGAVHQSRCNRFITNVSNVELNNELTKFWIMEEINNAHCMSNEEIACEKHFLDTYHRNESGRFVVQLPFKENLQELQNSKEIALRRFLTLENKLEKSPALYDEYRSFMNEYEVLQHMSLLCDDESKKLTGVFYLPHHGVVKPDSTTTKLRVVFDGTINSRQGTSLNDVLMVGPRLQDELFSILVRFRCHNYVLIGDIAKMYRQILIDSKHQDFQRILWRKNKSSPILTYKLKTVTYGTASAPYLAVRCLQQLATDEREAYPLGSSKLLSDFYVDDLLTGGHTIDDVVQIRKEIILILDKAGFELRKLASNCNTILGNSDGSSSICLDKENYNKTLGLLWNSKLDNFHFSVKPINTSSITKRTILSVIAQLFDPLGLLGPVIVTAKLIIQQLWSRKLDWDEPVPKEIGRVWLQFVSNFDKLINIEIPRQMFVFNFEDNIELHGFCDASQKAYGACVYARSVSSNGSIKSHLICAKSRVAPLKTVSLPRLELCGALLVSELIDKVRVAINREASLFLWTDSSIVLSWLAGSPNKWNTFVANRVSKIHTLTTLTSWNHVGTHDNPADIISRGVYPHEIKGNSLWWHGPSWLPVDSHSWPRTNFTVQNELPETKKIIVNASYSNYHELLRYERFSSFWKIQRTLAFVIKFIFNCRNNVKKPTTLQPEEIKVARQYILRNIQLSEFSSEFKDLSKNRNVNHSSRLKNLSPFLDSENIIRVGGRLSNALVEFDYKYPVILPSKHFVTHLIIRNTHEREMHAGAQGTLTAIRQNYWIISGRSTCRQIINKCVKCFRCRPQSVSQKMGNLPELRVQAARPFQNCGVDYAGPILIREGNKRGRHTVKAYIALFICFSTKAIHIELVSDLTTESFLGAFRRFIARRGCISNIHSDNASNFIGACNELKELSSFVQSESFKRAVIEFSSCKNIKWHFIPSRSPHFGGLWEAGIKSVKGHLKRVIGESVLTYEELYTILTCIEAILNSRPLTPLTNDPNDLSVLTPGHFLIGDALTAPAEPAIVQLKSNTLSRWQRVEQIRQHFWLRWHREYLHQLQTRSKWHDVTNQEPKEGQLVLLIEDNVPPLRWPLGRITSVHRGKDNLIRVVSVKTTSALVKRSIKKICLLPINTE